MKKRDKKSELELCNVMCELKQNLKNITKAISSIGSIKIRHPEEVRDLLNSQQEKSQQVIKDYVYPNIRVH